MITVITKVELPAYATLGELLDFANAAVSKGIPLTAKVETPDPDSYEDEWEYVGRLRVEHTVTEPLSTPQDAV